MYRASKKEFSTSYSFDKQGTSEGSKWFHIYHKVTNTNASCSEAPPSCYTLFMKWKFYIYFLWLFEKKLIS